MVFEVFMVMDYFVKIELELMRNIFDYEFVVGEYRIVYLYCKITYEGDKSFDDEAKFARYDVKCVKC